MQQHRPCAGQRRQRRARRQLGAARRRDLYDDSVEELTPLRGDLRTSVPVAAAALATLVRPSAWRMFSGGAVTRYALTAAGWRAIRSAADPEHVGPSADGPT